MARLRWLALLLTFGVFASTGMLAQEPKDKKVEPTVEKTDPTKEPEPIARGYLPANWKLLGLTDQQKQEVYKRQTNYREKIARLEAQIDDLKAKQKKDIEDVLTVEQKKRLREILLEKAPKESK